MQATFSMQQFFSYLYKRLNTLSRTPSMVRKFLILLLVSGICTPRITHAQSFDRGDTLRGTLSPLRSCYDVTFYDLEIKVDPETRSIGGRNIIRFKAVNDCSQIQVDLYANMFVDKIEMEGQTLAYSREFDAVFIDLPRMIRESETASLTIHYSGKPRAAVRAPWDGGFVWNKDKNGKHWIGVACEGAGASLWWPLKDHLSDEPDSMRISTIVPEGLMSVSNGVLRSTRDAAPGWKRWEWYVSYPINSYNVTVNIADYVHIHDTYTNETGVYDLDYYVLSYNKALAEKQFEQVKPMMEVFEKHFGEYPFWNDGYALVETPYLGMEHQGAIAYGNKYKKGYDGMDMLGLGFDYIIIHESGHEWWGNSVSTDDHAELWIHESFCTYSESVYIENLWDKETAVRYLVYQKGNIANRDPVAGPRGVNFEDFASSDMYYKGAWMLHTLRNVVNDDAKWWAALKKFAETFRIRVTNTEEVIQWWSTELGMDLKPFFRQYLYHAELPEIQVRKWKASSKGIKFQYRLLAAEPGFSIPVGIRTDEGKVEIIHPTAEWQKAKFVGNGEKAGVDGTMFLYKVSKDD